MDNFQTGSFNRIDSFGYSNGSSTHNSGIGSTLYPKINNTYDVGSSNQDGMIYMQQMVQSIHLIKNKY